MLERLRDPANYPVAWILAVCLLLILADVAPGLALGLALLALLGAFFMNLNRWREVF